MLWFSSYVIVFEFSWKVKEKNNRRHYLLTDPCRVEYTEWNAILEPGKSDVLAWILLMTDMLVLIARDMSSSPSPGKNF